jgi:hypothetical protein
MIRESVVICVLPENEEIAKSLFIEINNFIGKNIIVGLI